MLAGEKDYVMSYDKDTNSFVIEKLQYIVPNLKEFRDLHTKAGR